MGKKRDTVVYELYDNRKKVYIGITDDPIRREQEHKDEGKNFKSMKVITPKLKNESAIEREEQMIEMYQKNHNGRMPRYNKKK